MQGALAPWEVKKLAEWFRENSDRQTDRPTRYEFYGLTDNQILERPLALNLVRAASSAKER